MKSSRTQLEEIFNKIIIIHDEHIHFHQLKIFLINKRKVKRISKIIDIGRN